MEWKDKIGSFKQIDIRDIQDIKKQGKEHSEICEMLKEKFGEKNLDEKV